MTRVQNLIFNTTYLLILAFACASCHTEDQIPVSVQFDYQIPEGGYTVPVQIELTNKTTGADFYRWTLEGGSPASSDKKQPGRITYAQAGIYTLRLEAWNDTQRMEKEVTIELDSAVSLDFNPVVLVNDFVPAIVQIDNMTQGASTYEWAFEGGTPATSDLPNPPQILFESPGEHLISLKVTNGRETFTMSRTIALKPSMQTAFEIVPSFDDLDYEAPLIAVLQNETVNGLRYKWTSTGGAIADEDAKNTEIYFASPGDYTITLQADNDKVTQLVEHTISVKPNSNLYTVENVKLGVSAAHATIGSFYCGKLRDVLTRDEVNEQNESSIVMAFFGINSSFGYCRFISPDSVGEFGFQPLAVASHTWFVNTIESTPLLFTSSDFDNMTNDLPLMNLDIRNYETGISFFESGSIPRIVLFETGDGRKGAIRINSFIADGTQSYILADIKMQKAP